MFINDPSFAQIAGFLVAYFAFILVVALASYIINSLFYYKIGKDINAPSPWMAWVPYFSSYYQGKIAGIISDDFSFFRYYCISFLAFLFTSIVQTILIVYTMVVQSSAVAFGVLGFSLLFFIAAMAFTIFQYIAMYRIFQAYSPENAALFLILSILFPFAMLIIYIYILAQLKKNGSVKPILDSDRFGFFLIFRP